MAEMVRRKQQATATRAWLFLALASSPRTAQPSRRALHSPLPRDPSPNERGGPHADALPRYSHQESLGADGESASEDLETVDAWGRVEPALHGVLLDWSEDLVGFGGVGGSVVGNVHAGMLTS